MRSLALPQLALAVRQRSDIGGQQSAFGGNGSSNVTDTEMTTMLNASIGMVWDILCSKFGDNYAWGVYLIPVVQGKYTYQLPPDFYKELGVDLSLDGTGQNWATVRPYTLRDRNIFSYPLQNVLGYAGWQNVRWQIQGNNLNFLPNIGPIPGMMRLLYYPCAPILCASLPAAWVANTAYAQGSLVSYNVTTGDQPVQQVFVALSAGSSGSTAPVWPVPGTVADGTVQWAYQGPLSLFATTFDGISGYEDLVILDTVIKCATKQEADTSAYEVQMQRWLARIAAAAANRAAGDPMVISGGFGRQEGGTGFGGTGFGQGWYGE